MIEGRIPKTDIDVGQIVVETQARIGARAQPHRVPGTRYGQSASDAENNLAGCIDHTLLSADADREAVDRLCQQAQKWSTASVCVNPIWVSLASRNLRSSSVRVCSVVGFPFGASLSALKAKEAHMAVEEGASEIDMVMALGKFRSGCWEFVLDDIVQVRQAIGDLVLKVIIETGLWEDDQIVQAATIAVAAGADYVKTSTGFLAGGATLPAVRLLRTAVGATAGVKASGGIKTRQAAWSMIAAGADRLGCSQTEVLLQGD